MDATLAKAIVDAASSSDDLEIRSDYSGRGMHGETTTAIIFGQETDLLAAMLRLAYRMGWRGEQKDLFLLLEESKSWIRDEMGKDTIIY